MAYFETLGQLQSNDYTFQEILSYNGNPSNHVIDGVKFGISVNDIILMVGETHTGAGSSSASNPSVSSSVSSVSISGTSTLFSSNVSSGASYWKNGDGYGIGGISTVFVFIGLVSQTALTIVGSYSGGDITMITLYRLCPRN